MIRGEDMNIKKELNPIFTTAVWKDNEIGYASAANVNGFFEMDFDGKTCKFFHYFDDEKIKGQELYNAIIPYNNELFLIPGSADYLMIFDPSRKTFKKVYVRNSKLSPWHDYAKYGDAIVVDNTMYLIPERYSYVAKVDLKTLKAEFVDIQDEECVWKRRSTVVEGGLLKVVSLDNKKQLVFNVRTCKVQIRQFNGEKNGANKKTLPEESVNLANEKYTLTDGSDLYWDKIFSAYEKRGAVTINEEADWISFSDMVSYVEWKKGK